MYKVNEAIEYFSKYNIPLDKIYSNGKKRGLPQHAVKEAIEWFLNIKPDTLCTCNHRHKTYCDVCGCMTFSPQVPRARIVWRIWEKAEEFKQASALREHLDEYKTSADLIEDKKCLTEENTNLRFAFIMAAIIVLGLSIYIFGSIQ